LDFLVLLLDDIVDLLGSDELLGIDFLGRRCVDARGQLLGLVVLFVLGNEDAIILGDVDS
jgi:hypothetical protein